VAQLGAASSRSNCIGSASRCEYAPGLIETGTGCRPWLALADVPVLAVGHVPEIEPSRDLYSGDWSVSGLNSQSQVTRVWSGACRPEGVNIT